MDVVTNGCNGTHHDGERTENQTNVILSTLPHSKNNVNDSSANSNAGSISNKSIKSVKTKRSKKSEALLDDNRYALRIEDMVEEHLKFGRSAFEFVTISCFGKLCIVEIDQLSLRNYPVCF